MVSRFTHFRFEEYGIYSPGVYTLRAYPATPWPGIPKHFVFQLFFSHHYVIGATLNIEQALESGAPFYCMGGGLWLAVAIGNIGQ